MSIQHKWLIEGHIARIALSGEMQDEDLPQLDMIFKQYMAAHKSKEVHFVIDVTEQTKTPNIKAMRELDVIGRPEIGWSIIIGNINPVVKMMATIVGRLVSAHFRILNTEEEAITFLRAIDLSIPMVDSIPSSSS